MQKIQPGFTLIELMVTVSIIGILASIAIPSYHESVMKSRRADAKGALLGFENAMERYFTVHNKYTSAADDGDDTGAPDPTVFSATSPVEGGTPYYNLTISEATTSTYTLNASPTGVQVNDRCGILTLTHTGVKGVINTTGATAANCW
ncbi:type IV pilin protein [Methylobacter psychrophilus]|uniref:type IV pilin protein n=1 Tax=Methylobacter psychrophilus TaxID=96941 RepID=UPI0021D48D5F|nr:type IV pilin protein [Methylobacter psychrophilus]